MYGITEALREQSLVSPFSLDNFPFTPMDPHGLTGTSILDYDGDGDLDIFATNGPGGANALYKNKLSETGTLTFVDVAAAAGLEAVAMDAAGSCHGDIDNDGDPDLMVLGRGEASRLYENQGDGTFVELVGAGVGGGTRTQASCSMGDIDNDGLLDIAVAAAFDNTLMLPILAEPYALNEPNMLWHNQGNGTFVDIAEAAGLYDLDGIPPGQHTITWAITIVDVDQDGDQDIVHADDQGAMPTPKWDPINGVERGMVQVFLNDGTGSFESEAVYDRPESPGSWMGLAFGDMNCDGDLDMYATNFGDYNLPVMNIPYEKGDQASRMLWGVGAGSFADEPIDSASSFGWGTAMFDADNDGDLDIVYDGGVDVFPLAFRDNPGILLENKGCGEGFEVQLATELEPLGNRNLRRNVRGLAMGDLDRDGFVDLVNAANYEAPAPIPLVPGPATYDDVLDDTACFIPTMNPGDLPGELVWSGVEFEHGNLGVELNDGNNNNSVTIRPMGTVDLTADGVVNRDGIGAIISFTPKNGDTVAMPITGGTSHSASHATEAYFGLGKRKWGEVEVLWPGGVRNRVYGVKKGSNLLLPEIPCSYDDAWSSFSEYRSCVVGSLNELKDEGVLSHAQAIHLKVSAFIAYFDC